jgi:hypothetical protein
VSSGKPSRALSCDEREHRDQSPSNSMARPVDTARLRAGTNLKLNYFASIEPHGSKQPCERFGAMWKGECLRIPDQSAVFAEAYARPGLAALRLPLRQQRPSTCPRRLCDRFDVP